MGDPLSHIEKLRKHRVPRDGHVSIQALLGTEAEFAERQAKRFGRIADLWQQIIPERLAAASTIESFQRGILTVAVTSASVRYNLDEQLRSGLLDQLRRAYPGSLHRVKTRIATAAGEIQQQPGRGGPGREDT